MNKEDWTRVCDLFVSEEFQKNPESDEISFVLLYKKTHTNKDGMWTSEDARENFEKMEALQLQHESEGKSYTEVEIFAEVLGTKARLRARFRPFSTIGEARLEEMRARQMEYEALLVKRSDMEQTMREHLQMIEEQQRKKDKELITIVILMISINGLSLQNDIFKDKDIFIKEPKTRRSKIKKMQRAQK
ncbi:hypothetical protein CJ030_MR6G010347 [Morella rubra]|uniref:Uncharacterized protein n=1 Tax=Morella rubra TaxID=262757 RepID=A0A6A1WUI7_9ROSI|nr:hypothetical protein CJ030_MR6G010347 [Morella rubra]